MKQFELLYDSLAIEEEIARTPEIDITGKSELFILGRIYATSSNAGTRNCTAYITDSVGNVGQIIIGTNVFATSGNPRGFLSRIEKIADYICSDNSTSQNVNDIFSGIPSDNLNPSSSGVIKAADMAKIRITNVNNAPGYYFGIGSRVVIYGR